MPPLTVVELEPYTPAWSEAATREIERLRPVFAENLVTIHHVGSTAIPGISAKPILDLMPTVHDISLVDDCRSALETLGYQWRGEYGLPGRRYCTFIDAATGRRKIHLHCFQEGTSEVERHLAFRDYLITHPDLAQEYDLLKARCRELHPSDSHAYTACKSDWISKVEVEAIAFYRANLSH